MYEINWDESIAINENNTTRQTKKCRDKKNISGRRRSEMDEENEEKMDDNNWPEYLSAKKSSGNRPRGRPSNRRLVSRKSSSAKV